MVASTVISDGWGWSFGSNPSLGIAGGSFTIAPGERVLLLGPSGSGKSTLLRALAGVLGSDEGYSLGAIRIGGVDPSQSRGRVGLVLQDPESQTVAARVGDDVAFGCENLGVARDEIWPRVRAALEAVGLNLSMDHPTSQLSGGQKQRLALAGALAMNPDVLLLDEPTANLDPAGAVLVRDTVIQSMSDRTRTLIVVDHNVDLWFECVDRVLMLDTRGEVVLDTTIELALNRHRDELLRCGVWLPDVHPSAAPLSKHANSRPLLYTSDLVVGRRAQVPIALTTNMTLVTGEVLALTGANGAGKSTAALTLGGLLKPVAGQVVADDALRGTLTSAPYGWSSRNLARRIGNVFQSPEHQLVRATVRDELSLGLDIARVAAHEKRAREDELLERLHLEQHGHAHPFTLSGGQKRRLSVATAIAASPQVLICDEPTFGQDAHTWRELVAMLRELAVDGCAVLAATHDHRLVAGADRIHELGETQ